VAKGSTSLVVSKAEQPKSPAVDPSGRNRRIRVKSKSDLIDEILRLEPQVSEALQEELGVPRPEQVMATAEILATYGSHHD